MVSDADRAKLQADEAKVEADEAQLAKDSAQEKADIAALPADPTPTPPVPPAPGKPAVSNLKAVASARGQVLVSWTNPTPDVAKTVARDGVEAGGGAAGWSGTVAAGVTSQTFGNLADGTLYTFAVTPTGGTAASVKCTTQAAPAPAPTPTPTPTPGPQPTGTIPPPPADPGWKIVVNNGFDQHIPRGQFPGWTASMVDGYPWYSYVGGPGTSSYDSTNANTAVSDKFPSCLEINLLARGGSGKPEPAAPCAGYQSSTRGFKRKIRFRLAEGSIGDGWYPAWLLWPNSDIWSDGEIDSPEGDLTGQIRAYIHDTHGNPGNNVVANENTGVRWDDHQWHTCDIEWTPSGGVKITLDGNLIASTAGGANGTPTKAMRTTLQSESRGTPRGDATILVDYFQISEPV